MNGITRSFSSWKDLNLWLQWFHPRSGDKIPTLVIFLAMSIGLGWISGMCSAFEACHSRFTSFSVVQVVWTSWSNMKDSIIQPFSSQGIFLGEGLLGAAVDY
jgi:hypothetical protein